MLVFSLANFSRLTIDINSPEFGKVFQSGEDGILDLGRYMYTMLNMSSTILERLKGRYKIVSIVV
jgi:hypothetical protein